MIQLSHVEEYQKQLINDPAECDPDLDVVIRDVERTNDVIERG